MAEPEHHVAVHKANGELLHERTFFDELVAWGFAEEHLFQGRNVTVTLRPPPSKAHTQPPPSRAVN